MGRYWIPLAKQGKDVSASVLASLGRSFTLEVVEERGNDDLQSSEDGIGKEGMWGDTDKRPYIQHKAEGRWGHPNGMHTNKVSLHGSMVGQDLIHFL